MLLNSYPPVDLQSASSIGSGAANGMTPTGTELRNSPDTSGKSSQRMDMSSLRQTARAGLTPEPASAAYKGSVCFDRRCDVWSEEEFCTDVAHGTSPGTLSGHARNRIGSRNTTSTLLCDSLSGVRTPNLTRQYFIKRRSSYYRGRQRLERFHSLCGKPE